jgi:hypothetical protein
MTDRELLELLRKIRSICEEGYMEDQERLDEIHRIADDAIYNLER